MRTWHRPLLAFSTTMGLLAVVCVGGLLLDPRLLGGQPIWAKPLKFSVSFVLYGITLAWMVSLVTGAPLRRWARRMGVVVVVAGVVEMAVIVGQVVRGRASHFDVATPLDAALWSVMGATIVVLWAATAVVALVLIKERTLPGPLAWGVRLGLLTTLVGMAVAFLMTTPTRAQLDAAATTGMPSSGAHAVGVPDGGPGLPLVGWSTTGGDLRIGHFVGLHALQGLPLLALGLAVLAVRVPRLRPELTRSRLVLVAAGAWTGLVLLLTWQALRAQPLLAPDALTLAVLAGLAAATAVAAALVLGRRPGAADGPATSDGPARTSEAVR